MGIIENKKESHYREVLSMSTRRINNPKTHIERSDRSFAKVKTKRFDGMQDNKKQIVVQDHKGADE
jgi:hypothetical protein